MSYPKQDEIVYGIVAGGDSEDPDPSHSGGYRVFVPGQYGPGVSREHLPFSRGLGQATQEGVTRFNPPPERGTGVICMKTTGDSGSGKLIALGTVAGEIGMDNSAPGNFNLGSLYDIFVNHETAIRVPGNTKETEKNGARIRELVEKGIKHKNALMKGIPTGGSLPIPNMLGMPLDNLTNVRTAIQQMQSMIPANIASLLPGKSLNLASIFDQMPSSAKNEIFSALPREISTALNNITTLMQGMESATGAGFNTGGKVDPDTLVLNAIELFKDVDNIRSISDLVGIFQRLQLDPSLHGLDKLGETEIEIETAFGKIKQFIDAYGNVREESNDTVEKAKQALTSLMSSGSGFPGVIPGQNFFGESSKTMQDMFGRLPLGEMQTAIKQMQKAVASGSSPRSKLNINLEDVKNIGKLVN